MSKALCNLASCIGSFCMQVLLDIVFCHSLILSVALQQSLQSDLCLETHLGFHADIHEDTAIFIPTADTFQIPGATLIVNNKRSNTVPETFLEHEQAANTTVAVFEGADAFELHMEIQNLVKADIFLRLVLFDQGGHGCPYL